MNLLDLSTLLRKEFNTTAPFIKSEAAGVTITNHPFISDFQNTLPEGDEYSDLSPLMRALMKYFLSHNEFSDRYLMKKLNQPDRLIAENNAFNFTILKDSSSDGKSANGKSTHGRSVNGSSSAILMLHGLNERGWDKYLPWAHRLSKLTGQAVVLFPIAFHMHRAPAYWSDFRVMKQISNERKNLLPEVERSSPANAAISSRLQFVPQRLFYSGLQTISDITKLANMAQNGEIKGMKEGTVFNIFGYSIGAFVSQIIMMSNPLGLFNASKCLLFCGGPTLERMNPVNKYILDSEAAKSLQDFYIDRFDQNLSSDDRMRALISSESVESYLFRSMLSDNDGLKTRKRHLAKIRDRLYGIALEKDMVMTPNAIRESLKSDHPKEITIDVLDPDYSYSHENPFPTLTNIQNEVQEGFDTIFSRAAEFFMN